MPFRDDDEAARARADALQVDLDRANEKLEKAADETEDAKRELAATQARLARAEAKLAERGAGLSSLPPTPAPSHPTPLGGVLLTGAGIAGLVVLVAVLVVAQKKREAADPPNPSCTLTTEPPGAEILSVCRDPLAARLDDELLDAGTAIRLPTTFETRRGTTPLTRDRLQWIIDGSICNGPMVARLAGYRDTPVSAPLAGMGCSDEVVRLVPVAP